MGRNKPTYLLMAIMVCLATVIGVVSIGLLHDTVFKQARTGLIAAVKTQTQLINAVARFDRGFVPKLYIDPSKVTISQVQDAFGAYNGFGLSGEFVVGHIQDSHIVFLLKQRNIQQSLPAPVPLKSNLAEPMRRALAGKSGVVRALDYQGVEVLAAYEPIQELGMGLVAKINISEIEAPFYRAGVLVGGIAILAILVGGMLFYRTTTPIIVRLEQQTADLRLEIAERKQADSQLRKLSQALNQSPNMIFITDLEGVIEHINPRFTEMTGYSEEEAIGMTPQIIKSEETPPEFFTAMWKNLKAGTEWRGKIKDRRKDGTSFWASMVATPVVDEDGELSHFIAIHEDITDVIEAEDQANNARKQSEMANRAKTELIANMSHELRTPLNAILGFSNGIVQQYFGPVGHDKYQEYAIDIHHSGEHLLELINDILDVSAVETGKLKLHEAILNIDNLISSCLRLIRHRAELGNITIEYASTQSLNVYVDERRMKQIMLNLLSNAVKFTPEGGKINIQASLIEHDGVSIAIQDNGIGMDQQGLTTAMTEFGQVDSGLNRQHEGTGLGLPLTKSLIELHGGRLILKSELGKGTTATVFVPHSRISTSH
ncbi:MAG: PAS domain S-box protein [Magnetovibrio sp.]|nr:PAS domain S-box protein [Magnetovibrio sp.]